MRPSLFLIAALPLVAGCETGGTLVAERNCDAGQSDEEGYCSTAASSATVPSSSSAAFSSSSAGGGGPASSADSSGEGGAGGCAPSDAGTDLGQDSGAHTICDDAGP